MIFYKFVTWIQTILAYDVPIPKRCSTAEDISQHNQILYAVIHPVTC